MAVEERNWHLKPANQTSVSNQACKYLQSHVYMRMSKPVRECLFETDRVHLEAGSQQTEKMLPIWNLFERECFKI